MKSTERLMILDGVRTPFGKAGGALAPLDADDLGRLVLRELVDRRRLQGDDVDQVFLGCVGQNAKAANIARVVALRAGLGDHMPAMTVHRNCASGMEAVTQAALRVATGRGHTFLVGGTESMSNYPLEVSDATKQLLMDLQRARSLKAKLGILSRLRPRHLRPVITLLRGLKDPTSGLNMGQTAEKIAREFGVDRDAQDAYALRSHQRAAAARDRLRDEILPVSAGPAWVEDDESVRPEQSMEALAKLRPVFEKKYGTVTAGNACPVSDGAVGLLVGSEDRASSLGIDPLGVLVDWCYVALDPTRMGLGPVHAIAKLLQQTGLDLEDIELFEINEAFAAQVLACLRAARDVSYCRRELGLERALGEIPEERLNVNGGAVALGHPVGATGARLVLTLLREMKRRGLKRGVASLCVGGGQGAALLLELP